MSLEIKGKLKMQIGPVKFISAENNLGCAAMKIGEWFYVDFFKTPFCGMFIRVRGRKCYINFSDCRVSVPR
jgi:hypothetical protein